MGSDVVEQVIATHSSDQFVEEIYQELKQVASWHLSAAQSNLTLGATDLAHEAISRLLKQDKTEMNDAEHALAIAALMIRRVLLNYIRNKKALKRGGHEARISLIFDPEDTSDQQCMDVQSLCESIERLEKIDQRQAAIVQMKYFGGMTNKQIAHYLGLSLRSVQLGWNHARLWLTRELTD